MTGGPISDRRLISHEDGKVQFWTRVGDQSGGGDGRVAPYTVSGVEFVRLWSMHILPKGFTKSRRYGGYSNHHRDRYLAACAVYLGEQATATAPADGDENTEEATDESVPKCPHCKQPMELVASYFKPSWRDLMSSKYRPRWYQDG